MQSSAGFKSGHVLYIPPNFFGAPEGEKFCNLISLNERSNNTLGFM